MKRLVFVLFALAGCSGSGGSYTYFRDVKPIVDSKCATCHAQGEIAPFSLLTYADIKPHVNDVRLAVSTRIMPPWLAGKGCNEYEHDRSLTDDEINTITSWVDQGAPAGSPADDHSQAATTQGLTRVDRMLFMPGAYTPQLYPDDYRCFLMDWPETNDQFVTGFRAVPGNANIVHHVIAYVAKPDEVASYQQLDAADATPGWTCFGGPGGKQGAFQWLGAWAPGAVGGDFPSGTGIKVAPGSKLVLQVHYNQLNQQGGSDLTGIELAISPTVDKPAVVLPFTDYAKWVLNKQMDIPAGDADAMAETALDPTFYAGLVTDGAMPSNVPLTAWSVGMHMHTHGTHSRVELQRADGTSQCLLQVPQWNFHWQGTYDLKDTVLIQPGDKVHLECHWDNSQGTTDLNWGEGTGDEMCLSGFYVTQAQ